MLEAKVEARILCSAEVCVLVTFEQALSKLLQAFTEFKACVTVSELMRRMN